MTLTQVQQRRLLLSGLVLFLLGWDLWAILLDGRLKLPDTFVMHTLQLQQALDHGALWAWLSNLGPKGPLGPVLSLPVLWLSGMTPFSMRLITVLAHGALTLQSYDLGRLVWGKPSAGLWAAVLTGTCPFLFGICRLSYHDVLLGVAVVGAIQVMLRVKLDRPVPAAALGVVLGLGLLTKHSFSLYMVGPGLWFVARRVRGLRTLLNLGVMGVAMGAVAAVWAVPNGKAMFENLFANASLSSVPWSAELGFYLSLPGSLPLFVAAVLSAVWLGGVVRRIDLWTLALLLTFIPMVLGLHSVTAAARYMIPVIPLWAVLTGAGLAFLQDKVGTKAALGMQVLGWAGCLGLVVALNLTGLETGPIPREDYGGIISPDTRKYDGYARALRPLIAENGPDVMLVFDSLAGYCERDGHEVLWQARGLGTNPIMLDQAQQRAAAGQGVSALFIRLQPLRPLKAVVPPDLWPPVAPGEHSSLAELSRRVSWLATQKNRRVLATAQDPDGVQYQAIRVGPPGGGER